MAPEKQRIFVVEPNPVMREGLKSVIEGDDRFEVAAATGKPTNAVGLIGEIAPDLVLVAAHLPGGDGIEMTRQILAEHPEIPVLIVNMRPDIRQICDALRSGAKGYAVKESSAERLLDGIQRVIEGEYFLDGHATRSVVERLIQSPSDRLDAADPSYASLTAREREVFGLLARGLGNREVAEQLHLKTKTVCNHRASLMKKLSLTSYADLVRFACRIGVVDPFHWQK